MAAPPPPPAPSLQAVEQIAELQELEEPPAALLHWIGEVDRYFCAIDVLLGIVTECPE
jgi:hypothetical protein